MDFWIKYGIYIAFGIAAVISIITIIICILTTSSTYLIITHIVSKCIII